METERVNMRLPILDLRGSPYDVGYEHGRKLKIAIHEICEKRLELLTAPPDLGRAVDAAEIMEMGERVWDMHEEYDSDLARELLGIADGAETDPIELLLMNGYTDFVNLVHDRLSAPECTAFWTGRDVTSEAMAYIGQTWDMDASARPYAIALRLYPAEGPAALLLSISGGLGLAGVNEAGIAVVINNLIPTDARDGVNFPFLVRKALKQITLESAVRSLLQATRCSGHNYLVADTMGRAVNVETTATQASITLLEKGFYVHTNHYLSPKLRALEKAQPVQSMLSSVTRWQRMRALLSDQRGHIDPPKLQSVTADHENGVNAICRHAQSMEDSATCAATIISPQEGKMWAVEGNPCEGRYELFEL